MGSFQTLSLVQLLFSLPTRQWSEFEDYIKTYAVSGDPYDPYDTDKRLPKEHRLFTICAECGR